MNSFYLINFQVQCTTWIYDCSLYIETVSLIVMYMEMVDSERNAFVPCLEL